jgi:hypothetical protein
MLVPPTMAHGSRWSLSPHARYWQHWYVHSSPTYAWLWQNHYAKLIRSTIEQDTFSLSGPMLVGMTWRIG